MGVDDFKFKLLVRWNRIGSWNVEGSMIRVGQVESTNADDMRAPSEEPFVGTAEVHQDIARQIE
jgi:hypothetical protein